MAKESYVIGIDAGGTGIRAAIAQAADGLVLRQDEETSEPDGSPVPLANLITRLLKAVPSAGVVSIAAGITKFTRSGVKDRWDQYLSDAFPDATILCVPDYVIAYHGALSDGIGITVVAGTGSVVYGENTAGQSVRVGGRGWEYGDEGSGTWLTTEMVRRTLHALDGIEAETDLTRAVCDFLGTFEPALLGEAARRSSIELGRGFLVPLALSLARADEKEAQKLFVGAGGWLAAQVRSAAGRLSMTADDPVMIAKIGGMWSAGSLLSEPFETVLRRYLPMNKIIEPQGQPILGAIRLAIRNAGPQFTTPRIRAAAG